MKVCITKHTLISYLKVSSLVGIIHEKGSMTGFVC